MKSAECPQVELSHMGYAQWLVYLLWFVRTGIGTWQCVVARQTNPPVQSTNRGEIAMMKKLNTKWVQRTAVVCIVLSASVAVAEWSGWSRLAGTGRLSMKSAQNGNTCAFAFRNDSTNMTLESAKIHYNHNGRVDNDIMVQMGPQQVVGGWTAYSVNDACSNVYVEVYDEVWR
jgi:hypothetical protein